jgi:hypothetical protein
LLFAFRQAAQLHDSNYHNIEREWQIIASSALTGWVGHNAGPCCCSSAHAGPIANDPWRARATAAAAAALAAAFCDLCKTPF